VTRLDGIVGSIETGSPIPQGRRIGAATSSKVGGNLDYWSPSIVLGLSWPNSLAVGATGTTRS
jgi:hypothetical protein